MDSEAVLIKEIEASFAFFREQPEGVKTDAIRDFRRRFIFVQDSPAFNPVWWNPKNVGGGRRGMVQLLKDSLEILMQDGYMQLLKRHPCSLVGNPYVFKYRRHIFTHRWNRHIYFVGLLSKVM